MNKKMIFMILILDKVIKTCIKHHKIFKEII